MPHRPLAMDDMGFMLCDTCRRGLSPALCNGCFHNREMLWNQAAYLTRSNVSMLLAAVAGAVCGAAVTALMMALPL